MPGYLYRLIQGIGENWTVVLDFLAELAKLRDPANTPILSDLEKEYGILTDESLSDAVRRDLLSAIVYAPKGTGSSSYLEAQLNKAGFGVQVHINTPSVDPGGAFGPGSGGELIVNSKVYDRTLFDARLARKHWGYIFFIGGDATRDADGKLTQIQPVIISDSQKARFREIVLKYKPMHSWAVAMINDADFFATSISDTAQTDTARGYSNDDQTTGGWYFDLPDD